MKFGNNGDKVSPRFKPFGIEIVFDEYLFMRILPKV